MWAAHGGGGDGRMSILPDDTESPAAQRAADAVAAVRIGSAPGAGGKVSGGVGAVGGSGGHLPVSGQQQQQRVGMDHDDDDDDDAAAPLAETIKVPVTS